MPVANPLDFIYPLDVTGVSPGNRVVGERKTLNPPVESLDFHYILPVAAPYYRDSVILTLVSSGRVLVRGIDWMPGHKFHSASFELQGIRGGLYTSILFMDRTLTGELDLEYQSLGGEWTLSENKILEILSNRLVDPRFVTYDEVSDKPNVFPPVDHNHDAADLTGMVELIASNYDIAAAIRERSTDWLANLPILTNQWYTKDEVDLLLAQMAADIEDRLLELEYVKITSNTTVAFGRRYIFMGDFTADLPTAGLVDGSFIVFAKKPSASPIFHSANKDLWTINGTDTTREGIAFDVSYEVRAIWSQASNRWEIG